MEVAIATFGTLHHSHHYHPFHLDSSLLRTPFHGGSESSSPNNFQHHRRHYCLYSIATLPIDTSPPPQFRSKIEVRADVRMGIEGGQVPLYRHLPKLRGIAVGMHAGLSNCVPVYLKEIETVGFEEGEEVSLE